MLKLRLMTYNIGHGRGLAPIQGMVGSRRIRSNLERISLLLVEAGPDIVALQEIDEYSRWAGNFDHLEHLRLHARFQHAVYGITNRREGLLNLLYGNALLSHHQILDSESVSFGTRKVGEKGFLFCLLECHGRNIPVVNLHLHYRSRRHRLTQVDQLFAYLHQAHSPAWSIPPIICGDFNTSSKASDAVAQLVGHLNHFGGYNIYPTLGCTYPSPLPGRALDFILVPHSCRVHRAEIIGSMLSDHRPVVVDLQLP